MALANQDDRRRVKVYELQENDWVDRGTGFCIASTINDEAHLFVASEVESEEHPRRVLLDTTISKDDQYQKQQDTLIVWTEQNGSDMALSFQESEACSAILDFVNSFQQRLIAVSGPDNGMTDQMIEAIPPVMLPDPELRNLPDIENLIRAANSSLSGRDALAKFIVSANYVTKLVSLVEMAEDLEDLGDLHRLCIIMKTLILLNDTAIIEYIVTDELFLGVVGALEYDPDFPNHKANHRQYLTSKARFKEVVNINDREVKKKIHYTYRLQYLKDVVLARVLDDPTFSVLNSLIFFHQVEIVQHLLANASFLNELFSIFGNQVSDPQKKKDAVLFIQQCCAVSKNIQAVARAQLYQNFINAGLFMVISFALRHRSASIRVAGTDILVALIDHDPLMMRNHIFMAINEKQKPLTDILIELLLIEMDLGVKAQMADAIKVLLDPNANAGPIEAPNRTSNDFMKVRSGLSSTPSDSCVQSFYDESAKKLFQPLKDLETKELADHPTIQEVSLFSHLVEILCFFTRHHSYRSKLLILSEDLPCRVAQLMKYQDKHLKLIALKYFRICVGMQDEFQISYLINNHLFGPILELVMETMPRNNLLNSACLELFEFIRRVEIRPVIEHLVETYHDKLESITYVDTFENLLIRYEKYHHIPSDDSVDQSMTSQDSEQTTTPGPGRNVVNGGQVWWSQCLHESDAEEEAYFNSNDDDDDELGSPDSKTFSSENVPIKATVNGTNLPHSLVNYLDDDDDCAVDLGIENGYPAAVQDQSSSDTIIPTTESTLSHPPALSYMARTGARTKRVGAKSMSSLAPTKAAAPPERVSEKRCREEYEDDELGKLSIQTKRRGSTSSMSRISTGDSMSDSNASSNNNNDDGSGENLRGHMLRRKKSIISSKDGGGNGDGKKIAISFSIKKGMAQSPL